MKSYNLKSHKIEKTPDKVVEFFNEIDSVCKKYGLSISHEDGHGAFEIENYSEDNMLWLKCAHLNIEEK